jgi:hypothetical protein
MSSTLSSEQPVATSRTLRQYSETHIDENVEGLTGFHENALFWNCKFRNLRGVTLKDCVLKNSEFTTDKLEECLGYTFTVGDCNSFKNVKYSEFLFDLLLVMMIQTAGNTEKRKKLIEVVGEDRVYELLSQFKNLDVPRP